MEMERDIKIFRDIDRYGEMDGDWIWMDMERGGWILMALGDGKWKEMMGY